ncbi:hypothetical protein [Georgenia alba]|uniref:Apolipoprotein N-acyltransferase n=1 Tax=Georgenia alba TaxID=2233858 RepID=A0ABW2QGC7_9MICO
MTQHNTALAGHQRSRTTLPLVLVTAVVGGLIALGPFGFMAWAIGPVVLAAGLHGRRHLTPWSREVTWLGSGLVVGTALHLGLDELVRAGAPLVWPL